MYPLGSCTMKYNPKTNERQCGLPGLSGAHPLLPAALSQGVLQMMYELQQYLAEITGMDAVSLQPAAGAHGELAGMLVILRLSGKSPGNPAAHQNHYSRIRPTEPTRPVRPFAGIRPVPVASNPKKACFRCRRAIASGHG